jgi:hypothetical protein
VLPSYDDIRSRINEEPTWFDAHGVPRYGDFTPGVLGVYDEFALLVEIACQSCGMRMRIGDGTPRIAISAIIAGTMEPSTVASFVESWAFGDPPRHGGCAGETMSCDEIGIIEAWTKDAELRDWVRLPEFERVFSD